MQKTLVTFLQDRTGSMATIKEDTIGGFNAFLEGLATGDAADDTEFTLIQFDSSSIDKVHLNKPVKEVPKLDDKTFVPRDFTPLIEAAIKTIEAVDKAVAGSDKKVVICIQTDGQENASGPEYTWDRLSRMVKEKRKLGWEFNFMGVGIDAYDQAGKMGIARGSTISSTMDSAHQASAYAAMASNTRSFSAGRASNTSFSAAQKMAAGDFDDPQPTKVTRRTVGMNKPSAVATKPEPIVDDLDLTK